MGPARRPARPVPGNHDFEATAATGYFDYFNGGRPAGAAGETGRGWYAFDLASWRLVALNSQCGAPGARLEGTECAEGSAQEQWLRADLTARAGSCTLAFLHHPRFASGTIDLDDAVLPLYRALHDPNADVVLAGHDHAYERFAPQDPAGNPDPARGLRQFVVGTGGHSHQRSLFFEANSEVRNPRDFGVLRLTLGPVGYDWAFVTEGGVMADAGSGGCH